MLTPDERATLHRLKKEDKDYRPLTEEQLNEINERSCDYSIKPNQMKIVFDAWAQVVDILTNLARDNLSLLAEIDYLKKAKEE